MPTYADIVQNTYNYDYVGNFTSIANAALPISLNGMGGIATRRFFWYTYSPVLFFSKRPKEKRKKAFVPSQRNLAATGSEGDDHKIFICFYHPDHASAGSATASAGSVLKYVDGFESVLKLENVILYQTTITRPGT